MEDCLKVLLAKSKSTLESFVKHLGARVTVSSSR